MKHKEILHKFGLYKHGECLICEDFMEPDGKCTYCSWSNTSTPEQTAQEYNDYWVNGRSDDDKYKRLPKTAEHFRELCK